MTKPGQLFCIDLDGTARVVADDVLLTNGLGFSPDGAHLYHADTLRHTIYVYDVAKDGTLGPKRPFVVTAEPEYPDGLAIDTAGNVWVALLNGGSVGCFSADGRRIASLHIGVSMATSLCFGGDDFRDLFISGSEGLESDCGGKVYRTRVDIPGAAPHLCKVAL